MCSFYASHLHVASEHLADHGSFEHSAATAYARRPSTLQLIAAIHIPSHRNPRHTGALYA